MPDEDTRAILQTIYTSINRINDLQKEQKDTTDAVLLAGSTSEEQLKNLRNKISTNNKSIDRLTGSIKKLIQPAPRRTQQARDKFKEDKKDKEDQKNQKVSVLNKSLTKMSTSLSNIEKLIKDQNNQFGKNGTYNVGLKGQTSDADKSKTNGQLDPTATRLRGQTSDADSKSEKEREKKSEGFDLRGKSQRLGAGTGSLLNQLGMSELSKPAEEGIGLLGTILGLGGTALGARGLYKKFFGKPTKPKPPTLPRTGKPTKPTKPPLEYRTNKKTGNLEVKAKSGKYYDVNKPQGKAIETRGGTQKIGDAIKNRPDSVIKKGAAKAASKTGLRAASKFLGPFALLVEAGFTVNDAIEIMNNPDALDNFREEFKKKGIGGKTLDVLLNPAYASAMMGENIGEAYAKIFDGGANQAITEGQEILKKKRIDKLMEVDPKLDRKKLEEANYKIIDLLYIENVKNKRELEKAKELNIKMSEQVDQELKKIPDDAPLLPGEGSIRPIEFDDPELINRQRQLSDPNFPRSGPLIIDQKTINNGSALSPSEQIIIEKEKRGQ